MDVSFLIQTATGIAIGALAYFMKQTFQTIKDDIKANNCKVETSESHFNKELGKLKDEINDLKADLPIVFTLREDFIRSMNNVDFKLDKIMSNQLEQLKSERRNIHAG